MRLRRKRAPRAQSPKPHFPLATAGGMGYTNLALSFNKGERKTMPPIETIVRPVRNRINVPIPKEYSSYSFRVVLVPIAPEPRKFRTIKKIPGLFAKISDEDLFSDDTALWEACS